MRTFFQSILLSGTLLVGCNSPDTDAAAGVRDQNAPAPEKEPVIALALLSTPTDYVCGMELEEGGVADTAQFDGKVYGFCHSECKKEFLKNPSAYLNK